MRADRIGDCKKGSKSLFFSLLLLAVCFPNHSPLAPWPLNVFEKNRKFSASRIADLFQSVAGLQKMAKKEIQTETKKDLGFAGDFLWSLAPAAQGFV